MCDHEYKHWARKGKPCPYDKHGKVEWEGKTYCIFHASMEAEDKRPKDFWEAFDILISDFKKKNEKEWDLEDFVFPDTETDTKNRFRLYEFPEGVNINFRFTQFTGRANFSVAEFKGGASFWGAQFKGKAYFSGAQFTGKAYFVNAHFSGDADFSGAPFTDWADFNGAQFEGGADFSDMVFKSGAGFIKAKFNGEADFSRADFNGEVYFVSTVFKEVNFIGIKTNVPLDFSYAQFQGVVRFVRAILGEKVTFHSTDFHSQVDFQSASISELDFTGATFRVQPYLGNLRAAFRKVLIENLVGDVVMEFVRGYESDQPFILQVEGGEIDGVFSVRAPLEGIRLKGTTFRATVNIAPKVFGEEPLFSAYEVNFLGDVSIDDIYLVEMVKCTISGGFRIAESDLSRAKFRRVDLSRIDFVNVEWTEILRRKWCIFCRWFRKTEGLYDEIELGNKKIKKDKHNKEMYYAPNLKKILKKEKKEEEIKNTKNDIKRVEEMYRAVASAYEGRRRYGQAGHFKAGEFEVRKCHANILERVILAIYRWISFYGEEVIKPLILLVLVLPLTTALIYLLFHNEIFTSGYNYRLLYDIWNYDWDWGVLWSIIKDWFNTIPLGYKFLSPTVTTISKKVASWVNLIGVFERMLAALFTSLFIFALRRKARR